MNNFREVNDDILREWILFREDILSSITCDEDRKHWVYFDEISEKILKMYQRKIKSMFKNN